MGNLKHTPGPWKFLETTQHPDNENETVSFIQTKRICFDLCQLNKISIEEAKANALLIAAAPDMLEALELVMIICEVESNNRQHGQHQNHWTNKVIEAIKKATEAK